jgi:hypothetical protein
MEGEESACTRLASLDEEEEESSSGWNAGTHQNRTF